MKGPDTTGYTSVISEGLAGLRLTQIAPLPHLVLQDLEHSTHRQCVCVQFLRVLDASQGIIS